MTRYGPSGAVGLSGSPTSSGADTTGARGMREARAVPELVSFPSGNSTLRGFLHRPAGAGPFPALSWSHGSERDPDPGTALPGFYTSGGYVFFEPHRRGHGKSPGEYFAEGLQRKAQTESSDEPAYRRRVAELVIDLHERQLSDTIAALDWLSRQPFVDAERVAMSGVSYGGIQTLLAAEADAGARAYVPFAPAAMAWDTNPELRERLLAAVRRASEPVFMLQAENDYSLGPTEVLGDELRSKGKPNDARVYPPFGRTPEDGHGFALGGIDVWGGDVRAFLDEAISA